MTTTTEKLPTALPFKLQPMKKVLIALDYDASSKKVVETGYSLAKSMGAEVILLHVIADTTYYTALAYPGIASFDGFSNDSFFQMLSTDGLMKAAHYFLEKIRHHLRDESVEVLVEKGDFDEAILRAAKHHQADIIVMGTHSKRWLESVLMGSVAENVLHNSHIPLFIIPTKKRES